MKLKTFKITNFRGYKEETVIDFDNLTAFVGKNDVGKGDFILPRNRFLGSTSSWDENQTLSGPSRCNRKFRSPI